MSLGNKNVLELIKYNYCVFNPALHVTRCVQTDDEVNEDHINSCVLFCLLKDKRVFLGLPDQKMKSNIKMTPKTPPEI